jgi:hypothetical protein
VLINAIFSVTGNEREMVVSWRTLGHPNTTTVYYGLENHSNPLGKALGYSISYTHADYDGDIVLWNHHTIVRDLKPNTSYWYRCGDPSAGFSPKYTFKVLLIDQSCGYYQFWLMRLCVVSQHFQKKIPLLLLLMLLLLILNSEF